MLGALSARLAGGCYCQASQALVTQAQAACSSSVAQPGSSLARLGRAFATDQAPASSQEQEQQLQHKKLVSKLLYRSRQRGFLELDLLVGLWADQELPAMDEPRLRAFEAVLDEENPDLFKWLTGQLPAPERLHANPAFAALARHVAAQLAENSQPASRSSAGTEWVRGWNDGSQPAGQQPKQQQAST